MFLLPTKSPIRYRGKYPMRVRSWSYARSLSTQALGAYLGIRKPVHLELNNGSRYIADLSELRTDLPHIGVELEAMLSKNPTTLVELSWEEYDEMLTLVRRVREQQQVRKT